MCIRTGLVASLLAMVSVVPALAQGLPGNVPSEIVGDWSCGETRVYITKLGSIELLGDGYRAGKFDARDGAMRIGWDEGGEESWTYEAVGGTALTLTDGSGKEMACTPKG